jgi:site-specific DNA-methyltransferase (adenine-specific)
MIIRNQEGLQFLSGLPDESVDLVLTDPPYITSRDSGMDKWVDHVAAQDATDAFEKTAEEWEALHAATNWEKFFSGDASLKKLKDRLAKTEPKLKEVKKEKRIQTYKESALKRMEEDYLKYGSIYGKKYAVRTNYGKWDSEFTMEDLQLFINHFYRVLKPGGTCIVFFDLWKITPLKEQLEQAGPTTRRPIPRTKKEDESDEQFAARVKEVEGNPFRTSGFTQLRFIEWLKTNPQPINSKVNYLTNCREIALMGIKKSKPTFNSSYDKGVYEYPIQGGKDRFHPTQKNTALFRDLIEKHSNEGDLVLDPFLGSGTTAVAVIETGRKFIGCELDEGYYTKAKARILRTQEAINQDDLRQTT